MGIVAHTRRADGKKPDQTGKGISMRHMLPTQIAAIWASLALVHCGGSEPEPSSPASLEPHYGQTVSERYMGGSAGSSSMTTTSEDKASENEANDVDASQVERTAGADDAPVAAAEIHLTDSQIAAITNATHAAEIEQSKLAERKARDPKVKEFARTMVEQHGQAKADLAKLIPRLNTTPNTSQHLSRLQAESAITLSRLETVPAADFDQQYIDAQIEAHRKALDALDTELIPKAINPELKSQLQSLRARLQSHLQQAQSIRQTLTSEDNGHTPSSPGNPGGSDVKK